jgi:hypothetical protein
VKCFKIVFLAYLFALTTFSCRKEYTCECRQSLSLGGSSVFGYKEYKSSKRSAKKWCESYDTSGSSAYGTIECELK